MIELFVVIVLLAILASAIVPQLGGSAEGARLRAAGREVVALLNLAFSRAVTTGKTHRVVFDAGTGAYYLESQVTSGEARGSFRRTRGLSDSLGLLDERLRFTIVRDSSTSDVFEQSAELSSPWSSETSSAPAEYDSSESVSFFADGSAEAKLVILRSRDDRELRIRVAASTGRVRVVDQRGGRLR